LGGAKIGLATKDLWGICGGRGAGKPGGDSTQHNTPPQGCGLKLSGSRGGKGFGVGHGMG